MWNNGVHGTRSARRDCGKEICTYAKKRMDYIHPSLRSLRWCCSLSDMSGSVSNPGSFHSLDVLVMRLTSMRKRRFYTERHKRACALLLTEQRHIISNRACPPPEPTQASLCDDSRDTANTTATTPTEQLWITERSRVGKANSLF